MINKIKLTDALDNAVNIVKRNIESYGSGFPGPQSEGYMFKTNGGEEWTDGFWTGMVLLAYNHTENEFFINKSDEHIRFFENRLKKRIAINHHDIGFLYSLSCVAKYKIDGDLSAKRIAISSADVLLERYHDKGEFIQAWGDINDKNSYFLIIDSLLNLPLLFWAGEVTGDDKYVDIAKKHMNTVLNNVIRGDFTTYHTFYFDPETGKPVRGRTAQGYSDDSCWARGQAWGIYGTALCYRYTKDERLLPIFNGLADVFISRLPEDRVPYWDMIFTEGNEPRDTSAAAIASCGILEMEKYFQNPEYLTEAEKMLASLIDNYMSEKISEANVILTDAMYSRPKGHEPEAAIYGDYYFMEALTRILYNNWNVYW